ncbi:MAG: hypothetical protein JWM93_3431 [Frankiales bacterium]|nr:hypothetical protein [Frankiales bacterium]
MTIGRMRGAAAVVGVVTLTAGMLSSSTASAATTAATTVAKVRVISSALDGPFGVSYSTAGRIVVAESETGQVTSIDPATGRQRVLISGAGGVAGVAEWNNVLYAVLGGPNEEGVPAPGKYKPSVVLKAQANGSGVHVLADLLAYELAHNPDGQVQLVNGKPVDSISNPFSMNASKFGLFVADGGANDVLRINRDTGAISTFFVPPTVKSKACLAKGAQANPGTVGCDPVPTGIAVARGNVYVCTLGAESPGASRIYQINPATRKVERVWGGFTALTGIAVSGNGTMYVSEVLFGAPAGDGPPPPGFDPATVGRITRIAPNGTVTHAQVTMPTGLTLRNGHLYANTWSVASFMGLKHAGKVAFVPPSAFK